jgi:serine/threonine protein kinase
MSSSVHCPLCGDPFPLGALLCPNDFYPYPEPPKNLGDSSGEIVVPTRVDIRLPFAPESEKIGASSKLGDTNKETSGVGVRRPFRVEAGTVIGEYVIKEKLGQGGMGEIWKGLQPVIGKQVAVKILRGKMASDEDSVERFIREAKAVNAIKHKALIDIFSFGDLPDGRPYFVMEYLEGQNLFAYISEHGPLPWSEILEIFGQLCEALEATHQQGIIHRDLKSENLFLVKAGSREQGIGYGSEKVHSVSGSGPVPRSPSSVPRFSVVKVLDFGLAKLVDPEQENAQLTQDGVVFGTPAYMSPEQCKGNVTPLSDIYSLGIILFESITGRTPFLEPGMKATEVMMRHVGDPAPAPSSLVKGRVVPLEVDALVLRLLSKDPKDRPSSCGELGALLKEALEPYTKKEAPEETMSAKPVFLPQSQSWSAPKKTSKPALFVAVGGLSVLAAAFLFYQTYARSTPAPMPLSAPTSIQIKEVIKEVAASAPAHPEKIQLVVGSVPVGAEIFVGDNLVGVTPFDGEIPYGTDTFILSVKKEGYQDFQQELTPTVAATFRISLEKVGSKNQSKLISKNKDEASKEKSTHKIKDDDALSSNPFLTPKK